MKNVFNTLGLAVFVTVITLTFAGCSEPDSAPSALSNTSYTWTDSDNNISVLVITEESRAVTSGNYMLTIMLMDGTIKTSKGIASGTAGNITLTPSSGAVIKITISGNDLTADGKIGDYTLTSGKVKTNDSAMTQAEAALQGTWKDEESEEDDWYTLTFIGNTVIQHIYSDNEHKIEVDAFTVEGDIMTIALAGDLNGNGPSTTHIKFSISGNKLSMKNTDLDAETFVLIKQ